MTHIPDPIEIMESNIEYWADRYEEGVCQGCGKTVDYDLFYAGPMGDGPALCAECGGIDI